MGTIITKPGGGGGSSSAFKGFKYNVLINTTGVLQIPTAGQFIISYENVNYGEYSAYTVTGAVISFYDADNNYTAYWLGLINGQPCPITDSSGNYKGYLTNSKATYVSSPSHYSFDAYITLELPKDPVYGNETILPGTFYFNFETSQQNTFAGTSMVSNLGGAAISQGTFYLGYGSNTPGTIEAGRSVPIRTSSTSNNLTASIYTAGVMTGTMTIRLIVDAVAVGVDTVIPAGSAAYGYALYSVANLGSSLFNVSSGSLVSIRVIQTGATSCGINRYGWTVL